MLARSLASPAVPEAFIIDAVRTPIGKYGGSAFASVRPDDLAALVIERVVERNGIDPESVDEVILGNANGAGEENRNVARMAALLAGLPDSVPGATVNRLCASGLEAVNQAARAVKLGDADLVLAGGVESMTRAPLVALKPETRLSSRGALELVDSTIGWRFTNPRLAAKYSTEGLGETAENVAERYGVGRQEQDTFALRSHQRAVAAQEAGAFARELESVTCRSGAARPSSSSATRGRARTPRPTRSRRLHPSSARAARSPRATPRRSTTAPRASSWARRPQPSSSAESRSRGSSRSASPESIPASWASGPVPASRMALQRAGLDIADIDLVELNEAFASQAVYCQRQLEIPDERLNVNGGAIALGHPLGCSGARLIGTLAHELRARDARYGLATLCIGVGMGLATIIESVDGN